MSKHYDAIIIGAGAAGLMCAITAAQRGRKVAILEHGDKPGRKILISGGGRCNFTNLYLEPDNYLSNNPHFCKSALKRYTQYDFMALLDKHQITYHEKTLGQLFCDFKAKAILDLLLTLCDEAEVDIICDCQIDSINHQQHYHIETSLEKYSSESLVVATGGLSIPKMGASDFGMQIAKQFGLNIIPCTPALVPLLLSKKLVKISSELAGISCDAMVSTKSKNPKTEISFRENILFTHKGLSGPAILQISNYWAPNQAIEIDLLPELNLSEQIPLWQQQRPKAELKTLLGEYLTKRFLSLWFKHFAKNQPVNQYTQEQIEEIIKAFHHWTVIPTGTEGYRIAEVTRGGVDCNELSSKTLAAKKQENLYFIGEVVDVTGWLGGYNFQWAWASGHCAGLYV